MIVSDRGQNFLSKLVTAVCEIFQVTRHFTSAYHPQTNAALRKNEPLPNASAPTSMLNKLLPGVMMALRMSYLLLKLLTIQHLTRSVNLLNVHQTPQYRHRTSLIKLTSLTNYYATSFSKARSYSESNGWDTANEHGNLKKIFLPVWFASFILPKHNRVQPARRRRQN